MALAIAQSLNNTSATTSVAVTLPGAVTQGNLLVAAVQNNATSVVPTITGWTLALSQNYTSTRTVAILYKVAGAGESSTVTANATGATVMDMHVWEFSGTNPDTTVVFDQQGTTVDSGTAVATLDSGATGTLGQTVEVAVAAIAVANTVTAVSWTNGYANGFTDQQLLTAVLFTSSNAATSSTASWTTVRRSAGITATFRALEPFRPDTRITLTTPKRSNVPRSADTQDLQGTLLAAVASTLPNGAQLAPDALRPIRGAQRSLESGALVLNNLTSQDQIYGGPGKVPAYDWTLPLPPKPALRENRTWLESLLPSPLGGQDTVYGAVGQVPGYDWPNPRGAPRSSELRTSAQWLITQTLAGQDAIYGANGEVPVYEWPLPRGAPRSTDLKTLLNALLPATLAGQDTIHGASGESHTYDWPNPRGYPRVVDLKTSLDWLMTQTLAGQDTFYGSAGLTPRFDWPNPRGPSYPAENRTFLLNLADLFNVVTGAPSLPLDWPNPRGAASSRENRTYLANLVDLLLSGQDTIYGASGQVPVYDWPIPKGSPPSRENRTSLQTLVESVLLGQDIIYGVAGQAPVYDWPLPKGPLAHRENRTFLQNLVAGVLIGQDRIYGGAGEVPPYDYPNPRGTAPSRENRSYLQSLVDLILSGQDTVYGTPGEVPPYDWPLPLPKPPYRENRSSVLNLVDLLLAGQDRIYGAVGEVARYDWPLPLRRVPFVDGWLARMGLAGTVPIIYPVYPTSIALQSDGTLTLTLATTGQGSVTLLTDGHSILRIN